MKIEFRTEVVNSETKDPLSLLKCPCGNKTFYITQEGKPVCAACNMTHEAAQELKDAVSNLSFE